MNMHFAYMTWSEGFNRPLLSSCHTGEESCLAVQAAGVIATAAVMRWNDAKSVHSAGPQLQAARHGCDIK